MIVFTKQQMDHFRLRACQQWIQAVAKQWISLQAQEFDDRPPLSPEEVTACLYLVHRQTEKAGIEDGAPRILLGFDMLRALQYQWSDTDIHQTLNFYLPYIQNGNTQGAHEWMSILFSRLAQKQRRTC